MGLQHVAFRRMRGRPEPTVRVLPPTRAVLVAVIALAYGMPVSAQESPAEVARRALINAAEEARRAGDHVRALDLALRAGQVRFTPSLRLMVAEEATAVRRFVVALDSATRCATEAQADATLRERRVVLGRCTHLVESLEPRIGHVTLTIPGTAPIGLSVSVSGAKVPTALWGEPFPVEPGSVTIDANVDGRALFHSDVSLHRSARATSHLAGRGPVLMERPSAVRAGR